MKGLINIIGDIGETDTGVGVTLLDVITQVKQQPEALSFDVVIKSRGGDVFEGWRIADFLKSLKQPTNGIGREVVASIATVIFGSCTTRTREPNTIVMLHLPMGDMGGGGTADEIKEFEAKVRAEETKLCAFYSDLMGFDKDVIKSLLYKDTVLNEEQTEALGITTIAPLKIVAKAYFNTNTNNKQMTQEDKNWIEKGFEKITNLLSPKITNVMLQDANGVTLDFAEIADGEEVVVGAVATVDGAKADGEFTMPTGEKYIFVDGVLDSIVESETTEEEAEDFEAKYNELKAELEAKEQTTAQLEETLKEKEELITNMAKEVKEFKSKVTSKFEIDTTKQKKEDNIDDTLSPAKRALNKIKNKKQ